MSQSSNSERSIEIADVSQPFQKHCTQLQGYGGIAFEEKLVYKNPNFNDIHSQEELHQCEAAIINNTQLSSQLLESFLIQVQQSKLAHQKGCSHFDQKKSFIAPQNKSIVYRQIKFYQINFDPVLQNKSEEHLNKLKEFKDKLNEFEKNDYSYFFKLQDTLEHEVHKILQNWDLLKLIYEAQFKRFLDLMKLKIQRVSESRIIYPALYRIKQQLERTIKYIGCKAHLNRIDDYVVDLLYQHYIQECRTKSQRKGIYYIRDPNTDRRIPLSEFISSCKQYFEKNSSWKDVFSIVTHYLNQNSAKHEQAMSAYIQNFPHAHVPIFSCLGCSHFFYRSQNIYRPQVCKHLVALLNYASQIAVNTTNIKDEVCALLNGKGGVLVFDCRKEYTDLIPQGGRYSKKQKEQIGRLIISCLSDIYPKPQLNKNVIISQALLAENPFKPKQSSCNKPSLNYLEGLSLIRLIVKPTQGHQSYFWMKGQKPIFSLRTQSLFQQGKRYILGKKIHRFIKYKFNNFKTQLPNLDQFQRKVILKDFCSIDHVCIDHENIFKFICQNIYPQQDFKYASAVFANKSDHKAIRKNLLRYNIQCVILSPFQNLKIKGFAHTAILYHNARFDELLSVVANNKDFEFYGKNMLVILITQFIKLTERNQRNKMSEADFNNLEVWLKKQYPKEDLKMWKFVNNNSTHQFYIETGSKESSLYMYIVMDHFLERSSFKNPEKLEFLGERERAFRFKRYNPILQN